MFLIPYWSCMIPLKIRHRMLFCSPSYFCLSVKNIGCPLCWHMHIFFLSQNMNMLRLRKSCFWFFHSNESFQVFIHFLGPSLQQIQAGDKMLRLKLYFWIAFCDFDRITHWNCIKILNYEKYRVVHDRYVNRFYTGYLQRYLQWHLFPAHEYLFYLFSLFFHCLSEQILHCKFKEKPFPRKINSSGWLKSSSLIESGHYFYRQRLGQASKTIL